MICAGQHPAYQGGVPLREPRIDLEARSEPIYLPFEQNPGPCPRCGGALHPQHPVYLVATWRGRRIAGRLMMSGDFGWFCGECTMVVLTNQEVAFIVYGAWLETSYGLGLGTLGLASVVVGLAEAAAELGTTVLTDRLGKKRCVVIGLMGLAAGLVALPGMARLGLVAALAGVVLVTLAFEFGIVSLLPIATELAPDARASLLSLNLTAMSLGRTVSAIAGGWLWEWQAGGIAANALVGAALALVAAFLMAWGMDEIKDYAMAMEW
jgi:hypothetical protein